MKDRATILSIAILTIMLMILLTACGGGESDENTTDVTINGEALSDEQKEQFEILFGGLPEPGKYWYDPVSGLAGVVGGEAVASLGPDLALGEVAKNASRGNTGVIVNGREITRNEVDFLEAIFFVEVVKDEYTLDAYGNIYPNDDPFSGSNIYIALDQIQGQVQGQGDNFWSSAYGAGNSDGQCSYVSLPNSSGPSTFVSSGCG